MEGRIAYAQLIVPGSVRVLASTGDERNALLTLNVKGRDGVGDGRRVRHRRRPAAIRALVPSVRYHDLPDQAVGLVVGPG
jgi:hypothetical protein